MNLVRVARGVSTTAAVLAAGTGVLILRQGVVETFGPVGGLVFRPVGETVFLFGLGLAFVGYGLAHAVFCWRRRGWAVAVRAAFTAAVVSGGVFVSWRLVDTLAAPPDPGPACGMKWLADLAPIVFLVLVAGFMVAEVAAWVGWWPGRRRPVPVA